jgi:TDG/mug DNA glycosylase family protein
MVVQMETLADYLRPGLDTVFVGINPGLRSVEAGHYFANPNNRFWPAINRSGLLTKLLDAETDHERLNRGYGFTDVVKRLSNSATQLRAADYRKWGPVLREKLERYGPLVTCFHGFTGYRNYLKYTEGIDARLELGLQAGEGRRIGRLRRSESESGQRSVFYR